MSASAKKERDRRELLEEFNEALITLGRDDTAPSAVKGGLILQEGTSPAPVGLFLLADPNDPRPFRTLVRKFPWTDFKFQLPLKFSKILFRLSYLHREVKKLNQLVMIDELTGMYNLRFFERQLGVEGKRSKRYGTPCALILFDLDYFKRINDCYGHPQGNQVLKETAWRIKRSVRETDFAARYGGEEFAVLLPSTDLRYAVSVAERIRKAISEKPFQLPGLPPIELTISGGVAEFSTHFCASTRSLVSAADVALYQAKKLGRNRIGFSGECPEQDPEQEE